MLDKFCTAITSWDAGSRLIYSEIEKTRMIPVHGPKFASSVSYRPTTAFFLGPRVPRPIKFKTLYEEPFSMIELKADHQLQPEYFHFLRPSAKGEDSIYIDAKGLLFMDLHDVFKHIDIIHFVCLSLYGGF